jgi:hypothetical protein
MDHIPQQRAYRYGRAIAVDDSDVYLMLVRSSFQ